jgi:hypothetical protein
MSMSKWTLLKAAISGKNDRKDEGKDISIHRFSGFDVLAKRKIIWQGFQLNLLIEQKNVLENSEASVREVADPSIIQKNQNDFNCTYTREENTRLALKEEVHSCDDMEQLKDFIKNAYEFMSVVGCRECLLVINSVDSISNINKLEDILMEYEARNVFRKQIVSKEFTKEHSSSSSSAILSPSEDRMMCFRGAYYIQSSSSSSSSSSSVESSKSCQYFVYDLPHQMKNYEVEIFKVDALLSKADEGYQSILSVSSIGPPPSTSSSTSYTTSSSTSTKERMTHCPLDNTLDISKPEVKNKEVHRINNTINENIAHKKDKTLQLELNAFGDHDFANTQQSSDPGPDPEPELITESESELDAEIVYRMPRIFTREESQSRKISGSGLLSHLIHGVDNTGEKC